MHQKKHAKFSASSAYRWLACPGSVVLSEKVPPLPDSIASIDGTRAHECLELFLKNGYAKSHAIRRMLLLQNRPVPMVEDALSCALHHWGAEQGKIVSESKCILHHIDPEMEGTGDIAIVQEFDYLEACDFKYGRMPVEVKDNPQVVFYLLAQAHKHDYNFGKFVGSIYQPRVERTGGPYQTWELSYRELRAWETTFRRGAEAARKKNAKLAAGKHCFFCPAKTVCKEYEKNAEKLKAARNYDYMTMRESAEDTRRKLALDFASPIVD